MPVVDFPSIGTPESRTVDVDVSRFYIDDDNALSDAQALALEIRLPKSLVATWTPLEC